MEWTWTQGRLYGVAIMGGPDPFDPGAARKVTTREDHERLLAKFGPALRALDAQA